MQGKNSTRNKIKREILNLFVSSIQQHAPIQRISVHHAGIKACCYSPVLVRQKGLNISSGRQYPHTWRASTWHIIIVGDFNHTNHRANTNWNSSEAYSCGLGLHVSPTPKSLFLFWCVALTAIETSHTKQKQLLCLQWLWKRIEKIWKPVQAGRRRALWCYHAPDSVLGFGSHAAAAWRPKVTEWIFKHT